MSLVSDNASDLRTRDTYIMFNSSYSLVGAQDMLTPNIIKTVLIIACTLADVHRCMHAAHRGSVIKRANCYIAFCGKESA